MKNLLGYLLIVLFAIGAATFLGAAQGKQARVTQIIRDVRLLTERAGARPAAVNDTVTDGTGVRTGTESRAELTFPDQTGSTSRPSSICSRGGWSAGR